jgi:uncharacterized membrane protein YgcG
LKCPRCGLEITDAIPRCEGCDFTIADLDARCGAVPAREGPLLDGAKLFSDDERSSLAAALRERGEALSGDVVVVTASDTGAATPEEYAFWLFNRWSLGGELNAGVLLLIAEREHRVECEVGYAWEPWLDEEETGRVLDEHVVPALQDKRAADGVLAFVEQVARALESERPVPDVATAGAASEGAP